jgi:hypothetical protein
MSTELVMPRFNYRKMMLARKHYRLWWGEVETLTMQELKDDIARCERLAKIPVVQPKITQYEISLHEYLKKQETSLLCAACGIYMRHSNPPRDWTPEDAVFCCLHCRDKKGMSHGTRCQKCTPTPSATIFDEDNGY